MSDHNYESFNSYKSEEKPQKKELSSLNQSFRTANEDSETEIVRQPGFETQNGSNRTKDILDSARLSRLENEYSKLYQEDLPEMDSEMAAAFSPRIRTKQASDYQRSIMLSRIRPLLAYSSNRFEPPRARDQISNDRTSILEFRQSSARSNQALGNDLTCSQKEF